jgi:hypothetical protein
MNKIEEIFKAWQIAFNPNEAQAFLASERIQICDKCEHKKTTPVIHCGVCGCALKAKIFSPVVSACPKGKWEEVDKKHLSNQNNQNYDNLKK